MKPVRALIAALTLLSSASLFAQSVFLETHGFPTKTGFRGVFAWKASQPVMGVVHFGTSPTALNDTVQPLPGAADTAQTAVAFLTKGQTYYWQVVDSLSGQRSAIKSFTASNAYTDWNGSAYTVNLLIQLDLQSLPPEIPADQALSDIAAGINVFAERYYDAMDGYSRIGKVLITDTNLDYPANPPAYAPVCLRGKQPGRRDRADHRSVR